MKNLLFIVLILIFFISCIEDGPLSNDEFEYKGDSGYFKDQRDDQVYKWVRIGDQIWMAENLAYLTDISITDSASYSKPHYYVYKYEDEDIDTYHARDQENFIRYGVLYNWNAAKDACSEEDGWHLPTLDEWEKLSGFISAENGGYEKMDDFWFGVGKHLKSSSGWDYNGNGTNDYGFNALPGGARAGSGTFKFKGSLGYYWTASDSSFFADVRILQNVNSQLIGVKMEKIRGFSVRCIRKQ